jgi:hypothetical protein
MRTRSAVLLAVAVLAAGMSLQGCSGTDANAKVLSDAIYAKNVPVYKGAKYVESMGNESWGDDPDSYTQGMTWWFETKATKDELLAYYTNLYPNAERTEMDTGGVQLRWVPEGATRFEDVDIFVNDQELRIGESVSPNTRNRLKGEAAASSEGGTTTEAASEDGE